MTPGIIGTVLALLIAAAITFGIILPVKRRSHSLKKVESSSDIFGQIFLVAGLAPMSAALITLFLFGGLFALYMLVDYLSVALFQYSIPSLGNFLVLMKSIGIPIWMPLVAVFLCIYLWLLISATVRLIRETHKS